MNRLTRTPARPASPVWTLLAGAAAVFMCVLDALVVTTALPALRTALHSGLPGLEWTVNAYNLTFACLLLTGATLGDRFGRRRILCVGLAVFASASAAAALSPSIGILRCANLALRRRHPRHRLHPARRLHLRHHLHRRVQHCLVDRRRVVRRRDPPDPRSKKAPRPRPGATGSWPRQHPGPGTVSQLASERRHPASKPAVTRRAGVRRLAVPGHADPGRGATAGRESAQEVVYDALTTLNGLYI